MEHLRTLAMHHQLGSCEADSMQNARPTARCPAILQKVACAVPLGHSSHFAVLLLCRTAATNVFEKQGDVWKIVHHHGGPVPTRRVLSKEIEDSL